MTSLPGVTGAGIQLSGIVFDDGVLYYLNDADGTLKRYDPSAGTESVFVTKSAYVAASGGTQNAFTAGPVKHGGSLLIFDEEDSMGSDRIMAVTIADTGVEVHTPKSRFGADTPNLNCFAAARDGTVIGWSGNGQGSAFSAFTVIPGQSGAPIYFPRALVASALGIPSAAVLPSDESSLAIVRDDASGVEVLFGISGTGDIGKITFSAAPACAQDWLLLH